MTQRKKLLITNALARSIWIIAALASIYFFVEGMFFDGAWGNFIAVVALALMTKLLVGGGLSHSQYERPRGEGLRGEVQSDRGAEHIAASNKKIAAAFENCNFKLDITPKDAQLKHMASALAGTQTESAPQDYVEALFDGYASRFEAELLDTLAYRAPTSLANIMREHSADKNLGRGLDLGCGTGLAGVALKNHSGPMVGVDISKAMLKEAQGKGVYEALVHQDIIEFLTSTDLAFDYFVALDVFPYIGDLTPLLSQIICRNSHGATLAFSTEHREIGNYYLEKSGRYTHSKGYVDQMCDQFGYRMVHFETNQLRKEDEVFLTGGLYLLEF